MNLKTEPNEICFRTDKGFKIAGVNDIVFFKTHSCNKSIVYLRCGNYFISKKSLKTLESENVKRFGFIRCNVSYLVNIKGIKGFENNKLTLSNDMEINISRRNIKEIKKVFLEIFSN